MSPHDKRYRSSPWSSCINQSRSSSPPGPTQCSRRLLIRVPLTLGYVRCQDLRRSFDSPDQLVMVVRAPPETQMQVSEPSEVPVVPLGLLGWPCWLCVWFTARNPTLGRSHSVKLCSRVSIQDLNRSPEKTVCVCVCVCVCVPACVRATLTQTSSSVSSSVINRAQHVGLPSSRPLQRAAH